MVVLLLLQQGNTGAERGPGEHLQDVPPVRALLCWLPLLLAWVHQACTHGDSWKRPNLGLQLDSPLHGLETTGMRRSLCSKHLEEPWCALHQGGVHADCQR